MVVHLPQPVAKELRQHPRVALREKLCLYWMILTDWRSQESTSAGHFITGYSISKVSGIMSWLHFPSLPLVLAQLLLRKQPNKAIDLRTTTNEVITTLTIQSFGVAWWDAPFDVQLLPGLLAVTTSSYHFNGQAAKLWYVYNIYIYILCIMYSYIMYIYIYSCICVYALCTTHMFRLLLRLFDWTKPP